MKLTYKPDGQDAMSWHYDPNKIRSREREAIEKLTQLRWPIFAEDVVQASSLCMRALLWTMLRREHPQLKFDDVDYEFDELTLEHSVEDYDTMIVRMSKELDQADPNTALVIEGVKKLREDAHSDREEFGEGKAPAPLGA